MDDLEAIQLQINELQHKAAVLVQQQKAEIIQDIKNKIRLYGLTSKELGFGGSSSFPQVAIKYRLKDQTWTGRGRQPKFISDYLAEGGQLQDLLVKE